MAASREEHGMLSRWRGVFEASLYGVGRGLFGLPIEHPFDCVKTVWQANPELKNTSAVIRHIYKESGVIGFYSGMSLNVFKSLTKQAYRWPLMVYLPIFFKDNLTKPTNADGAQKKKYGSLVLEKGLTGLSIATMEAVGVTSFERVKVWLMSRTSSATGTKGRFKQARISTFFKESFRGGAKGPVAWREGMYNVYRELFRGFGAIYVRQVVSWVSFLVGDDVAKTVARSGVLTGSGPKEELSYYELMMCGIAVGVFNTMTTLPLDVVKTQLQKDKPLITKEGRTMGVIEVMKHLMNSETRLPSNASMLRRVGVLYTGWQIKLAHYCVQSIFTVSVLDKLQTTAAANK